jgi:hypothetical protein
MIIPRVRTATSAPNTLSDRWQSVHPGGQHFGSRSAIRPFLYHGSVFASIENFDLFSLDPISEWCYSNVNSPKVSVYGEADSVKLTKKCQRKHSAEREVL